MRAIARTSELRVIKARISKGTEMNRFSKGTLLAGTIMAGAMIATPAYAQDNDTNETEAGEENRIVVTGSRIQQRNVDTAAPVAVVAAEEFELSGTVNVENVVNTLPQVVPGTTSFSNNPGNGTATLNLRGLGTNRTLVLVNGRRWMSFDTTQVVDLNTIPNFLLDSVDVVTGGASAVYGSDAMSGVVNFNLKKVEGLELGGQYSITEEGDGSRYQIYGAIGTSFDDGRGSATVYGEYYNRESVFQGDRAFSNFALGAETFGAPLQQFGSSTLPNGVIRYFGDGDRTGTDFAANNAVVFDDVAGDFRQRAGDTYNYAPVNYLQIPQERYLLGGYADYEFATGHTAYTEISFVNNRVQQELAATPVTGTFNVNLATIQPFLNAADFAQIQQLNNTETDGDPDNISLFLQRRTVETGARNSLDERNAFRVLAGVRGEITDNLFYDAYYSYSRTRNANVQSGNISRSLFQAGLDGTGTTINIFGLGTLTPAMVSAISIQAQNGDISTQEIASASISGFIGNFGWGADDIGFAFGAEYRGVGSRFIPDTALSSGDVIGFNAGQATEGAYNAREVFAEVNLPIFETDGGQRLELTGAARYSDYSLGLVGGVWTYAGGVEFQVVPDIKLRGQYQRAVRAPNVGELFGGLAIGFPGATDPCSVAGAQNDAGLNALCIANGVPAASVGSAAIQINAQIPANFGGNPNLGEETSDSYTFGVVLQPSVIPGLTITADYFDITIDDAVATVGLQTQFDLCFGANGARNLADPACLPFVGTRNAAGIITTASPPGLGGQNVATLGVSGIDLELNYRTDVGFSLWGDSGSTLDFSFLGTWTESSFFVALAGTPTIECSGLFASQCGEPTPEFKWTSRMSWRDGPVTTSLRWRHLDSVTSQDSVLVGGAVDYASFNGIDTIDSYDLIDLTFSVEASENVTVTFGVNNLFDTLPGAPEFDANGQVTNRPNSLLLGDNQEQANTYPSTYDVLGRDFFISAAFSF
jgi:outer membrane receptor protein involved in Fe transport